jgi:hypothetical protein
MATSTSATSRVEPKKFRRSQAGDARFDERDLNGSHSELAVETSLYSERQAVKLQSADKVVLPEGDSVESNT